MPPSKIFTVAFTLVLPFAACTFSHKEGAGTGSNPSGTDAGGGVDRAYMTGGDTGPAVTGDACGANTYMANHLPPDLLILLDRSGSMNQDSTGAMQMAGSPNTKWAQMTAAINQVVGATQAQGPGQVRWGLKFFGNSPTGCAVTGGAAVAPQDNAAAAIAAAIAAPANQPGSSTPTRAAELSAGDYLAGLMDANPKYVLLATDGQPNCAEMGGGGNATDDAAAIAAVATVAGRGFPTFVIGIATNGTAEGTLNMMAVNGGHPRATTPQYYPVLNTGDLATALMQIQAMVNLPCKFTLPGMVANASMVTVNIGGAPAPAGSWSLDPGNRAITFTGATCDMLTSGALKDVSINTGCLMIIP